MLEDKRVVRLKKIIKDSFRIRPNHNPKYIDVEGHLERLGSKQQQVIFGRRGSGKSCLLVHYKNDIGKSEKTLSIYISTDEIKRLGYPDVLIRLLLQIMENLPSSKQKWRKFFFQETIVQKHIKDLRKLLNQAETKKVKQEDRQETKVGGSGGYIGVNLNTNRSKTSGTLSEFEESKLDTLERYLTDYKTAIEEEIKKSKFDSCFILLDDYYLIKRDKQPDVLDYLHRLFRGTEFYLKVASIRHRTDLIRHDNQTIGLELTQDVEEINLDRTLENLSSPSEYLGRILNFMGKNVLLDNASEVLFNHNAFESLVIASGGVPRDFLTIFVNAIDQAISKGHTKHLTSTNIWKAASSFSYQSKLKALRNDVNIEATNLEAIFRDLMTFCIKEKKRTCFLISQEDAQIHSKAHELILQLMDFKLIHVIEADTSAASGRKGRYEAYTLDFSLFMEPRKRGIEIVEFWKFDDGRRRIGVRESPTYPLERVANAQAQTSLNVTEDFISDIDN
ncbi:hypothetical protein [Polaribacter sp. Q13]|uniref:hypothetical protein n=1 Tax=Polaribacter sp. Q13 TaxID=2806551 RepID=UPI00193B573E|nr:hypothetical protein [Polaribacter sp. Q13]QVY67393.1 hypothetical protein JOP69_09050 [Polaribacter sp. Q13]